MWVLFFVVFSFSPTLDSVTGKHVEVQRYETKTECEMGRTNWARTNVEDGYFRCEQTEGSEQ